jgi:hypothetical protein
LILAGAGTMAAIFISWARGGYGALAYEHESLLGLTLIGLGFQTVFASFFLSVLRLRGREPSWQQAARARVEPTPSRPALTPDGRASERSRSR